MSTAKRLIERGLDLNAGVVTMIDTDFGRFDEDWPTEADIEEEWISRLEAEAEYRFEQEIEDSV